MLRWCLSTVRASGGRSIPSLNAACSAYTIRLAFQLSESPSQRLRDTRALVPMPYSEAAAVPLCVATVPQEHNRTSTRPPTPHTADDTAVQDAIEGQDTTYVESTVCVALTSTTAVENSSSAPSGTTTDRRTRAKLTRLKQDLSAMISGIIPPIPAIPSANTLSALYYALKAKSQLYELSSADTTALIGLFGSLSLSTPSQPYASIHAHPWTKTIFTKHCCTYWPLVLELGNQKYRSSQSLSDSDHFWLMHANLVQLRLNEGDVISDEEVSHAYHAAAFHYRELCGSSLHPDIHVPYIDMLLKRSCEHDVAEAAGTLSQLVESFPWTHPRVLDCLWRTVIQGSAHLTTVAKSRLLLAISTRSGRQLQEFMSAPYKQQDTDVLRTAIGVWGVEELVGVLTKALSGSAAALGRNKVPTPLRVWALRLVNASFSVNPKDPASVDASWANLVLLALANSDPATVKATTSAHAPSHFQASEWRTIYVLLQLERLLHGRIGRSYSEGCAVAHKDAIRKVASTLWTQWSTARGSVGPEFELAQAIIFSSFLYIAGRTGDGRFLGICHEYLENQLMLISSAESAQSGLALRQVLGEFCLAALSCGYQPLDIVTWVLSRAEDATSLVQDVMRRLIPWNPRQAHEFYMHSKQAGIAVDARLVVRLGVGLARGGSIHMALGVVRDRPLGLSEKIDILEAVSQCFSAHPRHLHYVDHCDALCSAIVDMIPQVSSMPFRMLVERSLLTMLDIGCTSSAVPIIEATMRVSEKYFPPPVMRTIIDRLVRHRQFLFAADVFKCALKTFSMDSKWSEKVIQNLVRGGAHQVASEAASHLLCPPSRSRTLLRAAAYRQTSLAKTTALRIQSLLARTHHDQAGVAMGIRLLIAAKRIRTAREFYEREHRHLMPNVRAAIGNELIHASFIQRSRRHPHRMKSALRVLKDLTTNCQFIPDRVTMNILVKGLLQWDEELDKRGVRALFDRLVLSGYPTGGLYDSGDAPFGSTLSGSTLSGQKLAAPLPEVTSLISFPKHVNPLYKMFVKGMYARHDVHGARKVVGILKAAQAQWEESRRGRELRVERCDVPQ
ncbi:hypothetical protein BC835DRAFT_1318781 [Cytidiella melzeri]|nr:hypothetical protein BC835DRAFT_1318781 [Cytidiella melzeri]